MFLYLYRISLHLIVSLTTHLTEGLFICHGVGSNQVQLSEFQVLKSFSLQLHILHTLQI